MQRASNQTFYGSGLRVRGDNNTFFGSKCEIVGDNNTCYGSKCVIRGDNNINYGSFCRFRGDNITNYGDGCILSAGDNYVDHTQAGSDSEEEEGLNIASWDSGGISVQMVSQGGRTRRPSTIRVGGSVGAIGRGARGFILANSGSGNVAVSGSGPAAASGRGAVAVSGSGPAVASGSGSVSAISSVSADNGVAIGVNHGVSVNTFGSAPIPDGATVETPKLKKISSDTVLVEGTKLPTVNIGSILPGNKTRIQGVLFKSKNSISVRTTESGIEVSGLAEDEVRDLVGESGPAASE